MVKRYIFDFGGGLTVLRREGNCRLARCASRSYVFFSTILVLKWIRKNFFLFSRSDEIRIKISFLQL